MGLTLFRAALLIAVASAFPMFVVGSVVYRALPRLTKSAAIRLMLSLAVSLYWFLAIPWVFREVPNLPSWVERAIRLMPGFVLVAGVTFHALALAGRTLSQRGRIATAVLVGVAVIAGFETWTLDGFDGAVELFFRGDRTTYALQYSDAGFRRIRLGMTPAEVETILGRPLDDWSTGHSDGRRHWDWSTSGDGSKNYRMRVVTFVQDRVVEKSSYVHDWD